MVPAFHGCKPEIAYFEVLHELKLIVDFTWEGGPRVITPEVKENMNADLADIRTGAFAKRFIDDQDAGAPEFLELRKKGEEHPIEETGRELRQLFSWKTTDDYTEGSVAR